MGKVVPSLVWHQVAGGESTMSKTAAVVVCYMMQCQLQGDDKQETLSYGPANTHADEAESSDYCWHVSKRSSNIVEPVGM